MKTNLLAFNARLFLLAIPIIVFRKRVGLSHLVRLLPGIKLQKGYVLECVEFDDRVYDEFDIQSAWYELYVRDVNKKPIPNIRVHEYRGIGELISKVDGYFEIWDKLDVEPTEKGIWSAYLLSITWRFLPLDWHALCSRITVITDANKLPKIAGIRIKDITSNKVGVQNRKRSSGFESIKEIKKLVEIRGDSSLLPSVTIVDCNHASLTYSYWSEWSGLNRENVPVELHKGKISFLKESTENLVRYCCGIRY